MELMAGPDKLICEYVEAETLTPGGLIIPSTQVNEKLVTSVIIAIDDEFGMKPDEVCKAVFVRSDAGEIVIDNKKCFILNKKNVLAFLREKVVKVPTCKPIEGTWSC
jgi:co-chaperonin GroES (HSP10)